ncbi:MAG: protein kinase [Blastocatellia bacterium]|nr:protein kinase [Blastocatellia bacterium]
MLGTEFGIGSVLDNKYAIESLLGTGRMGAVYLARQSGLDRPVAIKVVLGKYQSQDSAVERFKREAIAVARLRHPNIVTVYDFGIAPDSGTYLVMEYLEGHSLRTEMRLREHSRSSRSSRSRRRSAPHSTRRIGPGSFTGTSSPTMSSWPPRRPERSRRSSISASPNSSMPRIPIATR